MMYSGVSWRWHDMWYHNTLNEEIDMRILFSYINPDIKDTCKNRTMPLLTDVFKNWVIFHKSMLFMWIYIGFIIFKWVINTLFKNHSILISDMVSINRHNTYEQNLWGLPITLYCIKGSWNKKVLVLKEGRLFPSWAYSGLPPSTCQNPGWAFSIQVSNLASYFSDRWPTSALGHWMAPSEWLVTALYYHSP